MSTGRRAYDILRGFVNQEWERIRGIDLDKALEELNAPAATKSNSDDPKVNDQDNPPSQPTEDRTAMARSVLGVSAEASFEEIRVAFQNLNSRSDPAKFPEGSEAQIHASQIQIRVNWAYKVLTEGVTTTEKRFRSLELD